MDNTIIFINTAETLSPVNPDHELFDELFKEIESILYAVENGQVSADEAADILLTSIMV